jgi:hypothetical protein
MPTAIKLLFNDKYHANQCTYEIKYEGDVTKSAFTSLVAAKLLNQPAGKKILTLLLQFRIFTVHIPTGTFYSPLSLLTSIFPSSKGFK